MPTPLEVKAFLKSTFKDKLARARNPDPADDFSLLDSGIVDSFGLLDLVAAAEKKFGVHVDLGAYDIDVFATIGGFADALSKA